MLYSNYWEAVRICSSISCMTKSPPSITALSMAVLRFCQLGRQGVTCFSHLLSISRRQCLDWSGLPLVSALICDTVPFFRGGFRWGAIRSQCAATGCSSLRSVPRSLDSRRFWECMYNERGKYELYLRRWWSFGGGMGGGEVRRAHVVSVPKTVLWFEASGNLIHSFGLTT